MLWGKLLYSVFVFFCEESLMRDTNLHNKDCSEMHSGSCSQMVSSCKCPILVLLGGGREKALGTMLSYWEWRPGCIIGGLYGTRFIQYQSLALFLHSDRPYSLVSLQCYVKRLFQWQVCCVYDGLFQPRKTASAAMQSWLPLEVCWPMAQGRWYSTSNINCANHVDSVLVYCIICIDSTVYHYEKSDWSTWEVASPRCDIFIFQNHYC